MIARSTEHIVPFAAPQDVGNADHNNRHDHFTNSSYGIRGSLLFMHCNVDPNEICLMTLVGLLERFLLSNPFSVLHPRPMFTGSRHCAGVQNLRGSVVGGRLSSGLIS